MVSHDVFCWYTGEHGGSAATEIIYGGVFFLAFFFCPGSWWLRGFYGFYGPGSQWLLVAPGGSGGSWWLLWLPWLLYSYGSSIIYRSTYQGSMFTRCILRIRYTSIYFYLYLYLYLYVYLYLYLYIYIYLYLYLYLYLYIIFIYLSNSI